MGWRLSSAALKPPQVILLGPLQQRLVLAPWAASLSGRIA
jgi:hypothetical protein